MQSLRESSLVLNSFQWRGQRTPAIVCNHPMRAKVVASFQQSVVVGLEEWEVRFREELQACLGCDWSTNFDK